MSGQVEHDIDYLLKEITQQSLGNGTALPSDSMTAAIFERLKEEVAKVYAESGEDRDGEGENASPSRSRVHVRHPTPHELWKRAHEIEGKAKSVRKMWG